VSRNGKTYFNITNYEKTTAYLDNYCAKCNEDKVRRIMNQVSFSRKIWCKVDQTLHAEVLERNKQFSSAAYSGFVNPLLVPKLDAKEQFR
jgi:dipeptidyl-peptidase-3